MVNSCVTLKTLSRTLETVSRGLSSVDGTVKGITGKGYVNYDDCSAIIG